MERFDARENLQAEGIISFRKLHLNFLFFSVLRPHTAKFEP
jgi:hypothetical protein